MAERPFTQADLDVLAQWDTPTICNGLEIVVPERRAFGFTVEQMICIDPKAKPIVGLARVRHDPSHRAATLQGRGPCRLV